MSRVSPVLANHPPTAPAMFDAAVARHRDRPFLKYFDGVLDFGEVDALADRLAKSLTDDGFGPGDRLALYLQNNPAFVIGLLAAWKAGGVAVPVNPMYTERELTFALVDTGARALVCLDTLHRDVAGAVVASGETDVDAVYVTSARDWQTRDDPRVLASSEPVAVDGAVRLTDLAPADPLPAAGVDPASPAVLTYTSGTTGVPKACVNTHANLAAAAEIYRSWLELDDADAVLGVTPLFHITGLVAHVAVALHLGVPLVLTHRFDAAVLLDALRDHRPTFVIGTISALVALAAASRDTEDFDSVRRVASGGAGISPSDAEQVEHATGQPLVVVYGLTETTSPALATPVGRRPPVDAESGALSIGIPVGSTTVRVIGPDGNDAAPGEFGELAVRGPQVAPGYWSSDEPQTMPGETFVDGELRTGDIGFVDGQGWFYVIDRKKDMIITAGYKVWPREVEEVLQRHPDVAEVAVVGVPDEVRGESVTAFVALEPGRRDDVDGLATYARGELAAYKCPRRIVLVDALPKTATGKILRRQLRES